MGLETKEDPRVGPAPAAEGLGVVPCRIASPCPWTGRLMVRSRGGASRRLSPGRWAPGHAARLDFVSTQILRPGRAPVRACEVPRSDTSETRSLARQAVLRTRVPWFVTGGVGAAQSECRREPPLHACRGGRSLRAQAQRAAGVSLAGFRRKRPLTEAFSRSRQKGRSAPFSRATSLNDRAISVTIETHVRVRRVSWCSPMGRFRQSFDDMHVESKRSLET